MKITINAVWSQSDYGYIIGQILVTNESGEILMDDEDMYWKPEKFFARVKQLFINNKRFKIENKPNYYRNQNRLEIIAEDLGKENKN